MPKISLSSGKILQDSSGAPRFRILYADGDNVSMIQMDITKYDIRTVPLDDILNLLDEEDMMLTEDKGSVADLSGRTEDVIRRYRLKQQVFAEVDDVYGPTFERLMGKGPKPQLTAILEEHGMPASTFRPAYLRYLQSGRRDASLLDKRALGQNKGKKYKYTKKTGRPSEHIPGQGIIPSDEMYEHFDEAIKWMKGGSKKKKKRTIKDAYIWMCRKYYSYTEAVNGNVIKDLLPPTERPTEKQFRNYVNSIISKKEMDVIRTSAREVRNDKRLLNSDVFDGVCGPGDEVECDACEVPVSLVSPTDRNKTVGRPTIYIFVDVLTRIILAVSVALDQNSVLGITNLFLNLADDKQAYCARYGIVLPKESVDSLWPSNFIPRRIRCDRGAEFTSTEMDRICNELHIEKQLASPATGSEKGVVEHLFAEFQDSIAPYVEGSGLITKDHGATHHQDACLTIREFTSMLLNWVIAHNERYMENYPYAPGVVPKPSLLWKHYTETLGAPRPIVDKEHYIYTLMTPLEKAKVTRKGILNEGLWYLNDDPVLNARRYDAGNDRLPFEVRMDMRCVGALYYLDKDDRLARIPLKNTKGNAEFADYTMEEWKDARDGKSRMDAAGRVDNQNIDANLADVYEAIVQSAQKPTKSVAKGMREARHEEKQRVSAENRIAGRLPEVMPGDAAPQPESGDEAPEDAPAKDAVIERVSFDEALADFRKRH